MKRTFMMSLSAFEAAMLLLTSSRPIGASTAAPAPDPVPARNFTSGAETARKFGVHEIVLSGNGAVANPFASVATVTFVSWENRPK